MNKKSRWVIVIPTYNHKKHLRRVVENTLQLGFPVWVIDDGSTDSTPEILTSIRGISRHSPREESRERGGPAHGVCRCRPRSRLGSHLDADGQHNPKEILSLIQAIPDGQRPLVIGKREGMEKGEVPWTSRWGRKFSNFWVWAACGRRFSDSQSGFRIYPLPEATQLGTRAKRYQFEVEILIRAVWNDFPVREVPVAVHYGPGEERVSHFRPWLDFWRNTRTFARLVAMRIFIPLRLRK